MFYEDVARVMIKESKSDGMGGWIEDNPTELKQIRVMSAPLDAEAVLREYGATRNVTMKMFTEDSIPDGNIYLDYKGDDYRILHLSNYDKEKILLLELIWMSMNVKWTGLEDWMDSEEDWKDGVIDSVFNEITKIAYKIERDAKMVVPIDTGDLRKSIETEVEGGIGSVTAEIGTDLEYAESVEFGTSRQYAQPYLIPSFDKNVQDLERTLNDILGR